LFSIDPFYCRLVSSTDLSTCRENDGLVPYTSQEYPSAPNLYIGLDNTGPAHTREREASADVLYDALVHFLGVPLRPSSPPSGPPDPPGGSEGDGGHGGAAFIGALDPDDALYAGDQVDSPSGLYHLIYQDDGNLVLYDEWWTAMWASETAGTTPGVAVMQGDGNLVIYDAGDVPRWSTGTYGHPGAFLAVQDDGNLVVYDVDGAALWSSGTYR
jgi:hypothetical protein